MDKTKKFLITGGAGFIGSHLSTLLLENGQAVVAVDDLSTGRLGNIAHLTGQPNFQFVRETIMNSLVLDRLVSETEVIIHLAAAVGVMLIVKDPVHTIRTNIAGTEMVLNAANRYNKKVLIASSSEVYGKGAKVPFREDDDTLMGPTIHSRWAYAASKSIDEFLGLAYHQQYGLPVVVMRFFNTIGPRQVGQYGMVVPRFIRLALAGEPLQVYGDGKQTRCFTDVSDVTGAIHRLSEHPEAIGQVFNIGSSEEISIQDLAERIIRMTNSASKIIKVPYDQAYQVGFEDMRRRVPALDKIEKLIDYRPRFTLEETLQKMIAEEKSS